MKPKSQKRHRNYRINTQNNKSTKQHHTFTETNVPNSIVFEPQMKSLKNYFQFLQNAFGKKVQIGQIVKNVPHSQQISEQFGLSAPKKRSKSEYIYEPSAFQQIKIKSSTTTGLNKDEKKQNYRNGCKHSLIQIPSSSLKMKFYDSQRKRHSYLMQRMNYMPRKANTSPIQNQQFLSKNENSQFLPVGRCISKDQKKIILPKRPKQKLSFELMRGISSKRSKHQRTLVKHQSQINQYCDFAQKNDETAIEGPWKIIDTTEYNPRSYYSTYR